MPVGRDPFCIWRNDQLANYIVELDHQLAIEPSQSTAAAEETRTLRAQMMDELTERAESGNEGAQEALAWLALPDEKEPLVQMTDYGLRCEWRGGMTVTVINTCIEDVEDEFELVEHARQNAAVRVAEVRARMSPFAMQERLAYASFMAKIVPSGVAPLFIKQAHDLERLTCAL